MQRSIVLVDGSNFYYKVKELKLGKLWGFDFGRFVKFVARSSENLCDRVILVSSDTDLAPAIKKAKEKGKMMVKFCSESTLLKREDLEKFFAE